ncbi:MAG: DinB family protein [Anaerolineae bacterium]|nr:DinB family protein [Anaerolineae bacterium]
MTNRRLDFTAVKNKEITYNELGAGLTVANLRELTNGMVDAMLNLIAGCVDEDVTFSPVDPDADDHYATDEREKNISWTLGHVIVHTTASAEESAALAAELARGVVYHGRSRSEVPWEMVMTIQQCRQRLEESRRMRLASLEMWPDQPDLANTYEPWKAIGEINAVGRFVLGLSHDDSHLDQIAKIVRQAKVAGELTPSLAQ